MCFLASTATLLTGTKVSKSIDLEITVRAGVGAVFGNDETVGAQRLPCLSGEDIALHEDLVVTSAVDGLVQEVLVQVVVDVLVTEAASRAPSARVPPVVVVVSNVEMASVNISESIAVTNQGALPVVVEVVPGDSDPITSTDDIKLPVIEVRANLYRNLRAEF
jgi:hypothetical protein